MFFDEQLIAVKAYGGWRYTTAKPLIVERRQKTRGRFYLFAIDEVNTGHRRWAFYDHKRADEIGRFMKQIRRWYPTQSVWIALDRDSTHPGKCGHTRRLMRQLKLHWVTLPKGSPDDNPVENIFSDLQLMLTVRSKFLPKMKIISHFGSKNGPILGWLPKSAKSLQPLGMSVSP